MDVVTLFRVLLRRWYVFLPVLFVSAGASVLVVKSIPAQYEVTDGFVMLPPTNAGGNPFLGMSSSLNGIAEAVAKSMTDVNMVRAMHAEGVTGSYSFDVPATDTSILVSASGSDPVAVVKSEQIVAKAFENQVIQAQLREGVDPHAVVRVLQMSSPAIPDRLVKSKVRAAVALGALAVAAAVACTVLFESIVDGRRRRPAPAGPERPDSDRGPDGPSGNGAAGWEAWEGEQDDASAWALAPVNGSAGGQSTAPGPAPGPGSTTTGRHDLGRTDHWRAYGSRHP